MNSELAFFSVFLVAVLSLLLLDLGVFSRHTHIVHFREALVWCVVWICFAFGFYVFLDLHGNLVHGIHDPEKLRALVEKYHHPVQLTGNYHLDMELYRDNLSLEFLSGYLIEYALSVDNIFVMVMIFLAFGVNEKYYKRVLFWGVLGAIVMRFTFIFLGAALIREFSWILYLFGVLLLYTGINMLFKKESDKKIDPARHPVVRFMARYFNVFPRYVGQRFFVRQGKKTMLTPLFIVVLVIEFSDLIFAVDSVPAIFSVTRDPYIVFFSNIFAIMGLRSMFFVLSNIMHKFRYLKTGLGILLVFIGLKLMFHHYLPDIGFTNAHSLYVIAGILLVSILASLLVKRRRRA